MSISEQQLGIELTKAHKMNGLGLRNRKQKDNPTKNLFFTYESLTETNEEPPLQEPKTEQEKNVHPYYSSITEMPAYKNPPKNVRVFDSMFDKRDEYYYELALNYLKKDKRIILKDAAVKLKDMTLVMAKQKAISAVLTNLGIPIPLYIAVMLALQFGKTKAQPSDFDYFFAAGAGNNCDGTDYTAVECEEYQAFLNGTVAIEGFTKRYSGLYDNQDTLRGANIKLLHDCKEIFDNCLGLNVYNETLVSMFSDPNYKQYLGSSQCNDSFLTYNWQDQYGEASASPPLCPSISFFKGLSDAGCMRIKGIQNPDDTSSFVNCIKPLLTSGGALSDNTPSGLAWIMGGTLLSTLPVAAFIAYCILKYRSRKEREAAALAAAAAARRQVERENLSRQIYHRQLITAEFLLKKRVRNEHIGPLIMDRVLELVEDNKQLNDAVKEKADEIVFMQKAKAEYKQKKDEKKAKSLAKNQALLARQGEPEPESKDEEDDISMGAINWDFNVSDLNSANGSAEHKVTVVFEMKRTTDNSRSQRP